MKIAFVTGDIKPNGHYSLYHDLLANFTTEDPTWFHRLYLVSPIWDRNLIDKLKERHIDVRCCFPEFQSSMDSWWKKIKQDTQDCDVIISANITNLDDVLIDTIDKPIVSLSICENGYKTATGNYGSFFKKRFHKAAVSRSATLAFPEHVRDEEHIEVLYSGVDPARMIPQKDREDIRSTWFPGESKDVKLVLFIGAHQESKGLDRAIQCIEHLPSEYRLIVPSELKDLNVPPNIHNRVFICEPTYHIADLYSACDCLVLPTQHEGLSMALLEAWYLQTPVVTTKHKAMLELCSLHSSVDFGQLVNIEHQPKELAEAIQKSIPSESASRCVHQNYMAKNMVDRWREYLTRICNK